MKKLNQIQEDLLESLEQVCTDDEINNLGFNCKGMLCEYAGYENFFERLWVWTKVEEKDVYIVVTMDQGNGYCSMVYHDLYIKEIVEDINGFKEK